MVGHIHWAKLSVKCQITKANQLLELFATSGDRSQETLDHLRQGGMLEEAQMESLAQAVGLCICIHATKDDQAVGSLAHASLAQVFVFCQ